MLSQVNRQTQMWINARSNIALRTASDPREDLGPVDVHGASIPDESSSAGSAAVNKVVVGSYLVLFLTTD